MKLFGKLLIAILVIGLLLPFTVLKGPDGDTLMKFSDIGLPDFSVDLPSVNAPSFSGTAKLQSAEELQAADDDLTGKDIFYQWKDAAGNIQFTSEPPPEGVEYIVKGYDPNANVIQSVKLPEEEKEAEPSATKTIKDEKIGNPYSEESIKKLFDDAKNIEKILNQRLKDQDELFNQ